MSTPKHLVRTRGTDAAPAYAVKHPLNPHSLLYMTRLSDPAGMTRTGVNMARLPPGKEAFVPHAHTLNEEWIFVLEGRGTAHIGEQQVEIGPGDFVGYPVDGTVHTLVNTGDVDLVVLQGGERRDGEVGRFPTLGKLGIILGDGMMHFVNESDVEALPFSAWLASPEDLEVSKE